MKQLFTAIALIAFVQLSHSQSNFSERFDSAPYKITLGGEVNNLWQVGRTEKSLSKDLAFSSYFQGKYIITDTVKSYKRNNLSSFIVSINDVFPNSTVYLSFSHTLDSDTLKDGGFIEVSYDGNKTWTNLATDTVFNLRPWTQNNLYTKTDTIKGKIPAYSGKISSRQVTLTWDRLRMSQSNISRVSIRFSFKSDSDSSNRGGWAIDNINLARYIVEGLEDNENTKGKMVTVYPNPATPQSIVSVSKNFTENGSLLIYNSEGMLVKAIDVVPGYTSTLDGFNLKSGLYTYRLSSTSKQAEAGKIIMQ